MRTDTEAVLRTEGKRSETTPFIGSALKRTAAALDEKHNRKAALLLEEIDAHHDDQNLVDRLLGLLFPEFVPLMLAHYANGGPVLHQLRAPAAIDRLDQALVSVVPVLTELYPKVMQDAEAQAERPDFVAKQALAPLIRAIQGP